MVRPAARLGQRHHSHVTAGLSPFDSKRRKIQRTSRGGYNADTLRVGEEAVGRAWSPVPVPPTEGFGGEGARWGGEAGHGAGSSLRAAGAASGFLLERSRWSKRGL